MLVTFFCGTVVYVFVVLICKAIDKLKDPPSPVRAFQYLGEYISEEYSKFVDDEVEIVTPSGKMTYEIIEVKHI